MQHKSIIAMVFVFITALLQGCAVVPARAVVSGEFRTIEGYPYYGYYGYSHMDGSVRTTACEPYRADRLMAWATELPANQSQSRNASVSVRNDRVDCAQQERAGSQMGSPSGMNNKNYRRY